MILLVCFLVIGFFVVLYYERGVLCKYVGMVLDMVDLICVLVLLFCDFMVRLRA